MFRVLLILLFMFGVYRFLWGVRQGYKGREIEHPVPRKTRPTAR